MSLGARIKEERKRLGLNQTDFAALAGASRRAMVNWEADGAAPLATALIAWGEAGADMLYMLTGKRTPDRPDPFVAHMKENLWEISRDILDPARKRRPGESSETAEERVLRNAGSELRGFLRHDGLPSDLMEEAEALLDFVEDPLKLDLFRAADFAQKRERREEETELLAIWLQDSSYEPDDAVMKLMAIIALEYSVPPRVLVELANEVYTDLQQQRWADIVIRHHEGGDNGEVGKP